MAITVTQLTSLSGSSGSTTWTPQQGIRQSLYDTTNPKFPRNIQMDNQFLVISRPGVTPVAYPISALLALAITTNSALTWAPTFTTQPISASVNFGASTSFVILVNSELTPTYQWQVSTNGGFTWANLANAGVYTGVTTATLAISSVTGLGGNQYRCNATNSVGTTASSAATLAVVDPSVTVQPVNVTIAHTNSTTFAVTAVGTATLTYQWQVSTDMGGSWTNTVNGNPVSVGSGNYSNSTTATLGLATLAVTANNYRYRCVVTNGSTVAVTSSPANLTVT